MKVCKYKLFGSLLEKARIDAGMVQQVDLANAFSTTQQTVSRWEKGESRPSVDKIYAIAELLKSPSSSLLIAAGYAPDPEPVVSYLQHFPIWALSPSGLEDFMCSLLSQMYPEANVHRVGSHGHKQDGTDVEAVFPNGVSYSFQCKRHNTFGPGKVKAAVAEHTWGAEKKIIALTRPASPQARLEIKKYSGWDIWDVDDISKKVRNLSKEAQVRLVDTYFAGRRLDLLGELEVGPWQNLDQFFAPFSNNSSAFNHAWTLVGRENELVEIEEGLSAPDIKIVLISGSGGGGKSRILKKAIEIYEQKNKSILVRFLSPIQEVNNKNLEDLGDREKLIIIDDAHDRSDLELLFQYASIQKNKAKLVLVSRTYGREYIKQKAAIYSLANNRLRECIIRKLNVRDSELLSEEVIRAYGGDVELAKDVAKLTVDCPLATVIASQILAKENIPLISIKNEGEFRSTLMGKFKDVIAGNVGGKSNNESVQKILSMVSLLQPFYDEDADFYEILEKVESVSAVDAKRIVRQLVEYGIIFKRGGKYRISPDLLADYIIEEKCLGVEGKSTGYAEKVFDVSSDHHIVNLLVNLGKLDWMLASGKPSSGKLMDGVWSRLKPSSEYGDYHISAVTNVAFFQPEKALNFAEGLIRRKEFLRNLPELIKYAAYNLDHIHKACECLWELSQLEGDERRSSEHAIQVISELGEIGPNKSIDYSYRVFEFGVSLLLKLGVWESKYSPLDIFSGMLKTEGHVVTQHNFNITWSPYLVDRKFVSDIRNKVINEAVGLLSHENPCAGVKAAKFLQQAIRYPSGSFNMQVSLEDREAWTDEFIQTFNKIDSAVASKKINTYVLIEIMRSISWFSKEDEGPMYIVANSIKSKIISNIAGSVTSKTILSLSKHYENFTDEGRENSASLELLADELLNSFSAIELIGFLDDQLEGYKKIHKAEQSSAYYLIHSLLSRSGTLAKSLLQYIYENPDCLLGAYTGLTLSFVLKSDHKDGVDEANRFLKTNKIDFQIEVGLAYANLDLTKVNLLKDDIRILGEVFSISNDRLLFNMAKVIRAIARSDEGLALKFILGIEIGLSEEVANEILSLFQENHSVRYSTLGESHVKDVLDKLISLKSIEGYWIQSFLAKYSKYYPTLVAQFLMKRFEYAVKEDDWDFRPCNFGPYVHIDLRFKESGHYLETMEYVLMWAKGFNQDSIYIKCRLAELFSGMFGSLDSDAVNILASEVDACDATTLRLISCLLGEVDPGFVFNHYDFVMRYLERAKNLGQDFLKIAIDGLYRSAISGVRTRLPGEPSSKDVDMKESSQKFLSRLSRFSPAYGLYDQLRAHAEWEIMNVRKEREAFED